MSGAICGITANENPRMSLRSSGLRSLQPNNGQALPLDLRRKTSNRVSRNESLYSARQN
jgi:hypothetical protein